MKVTNENNLLVVKIKKGENFRVETEADAVVDGKGGPADTKATAAGNGQAATIPVNGSVPKAGGPEGSVPGTPLDEAHKNWSLIGDPHATSGGEHWENQQRGDFVALTSKDGSYQVQNRQEKLNGDDNFTVNTAAAVKDGDNVVSYDVKTKKLSVNGKDWDGKTQPEGGTKIEKTGDGYKITSSKGDETGIHDRGNYLDLDGKLGPDRKVGDIQGSMGKFDNTDDATSHTKRDGTQAANVDEMITDWTAKPGENLFNAQGKGGPGAPPVDGKGGPGALNDETKKALQGIMEQITALTKTLTTLLEKLMAGQPAAPAGPAAPAAPAADGKGGPAPADGKGGAAAAPTKTFAQQKAEDEKKAQEAADVEKAAKAKADGVKAAEGKGGPAAAEAGDPMAQIMIALKGLLELLTKLMAQMQAGKAPAAVPAAAPEQKAA